MDHQDAPRVLESLKGILRAKRITYAQIAQELGVHEATVKRHLNGRSVTLTTLESICRLVGVRLIDVVEAALDDSEESRCTISLAQESMLLGDRMRAFIFYLLQCGWTATRLRGEFGISESSLTHHLLLLDHAGLIRLMPGNRVKVLVSRRPAWIAGGPARTAMDAWVASQFSRDELGNMPSYEIETVKISPRSVTALKRLTRELADAVEAAALRDRHLPADQIEWHAIFAAIRPVDPTTIVANG
jgi:DNA-binding Xre family transcriptional regulator